VNIYAFDESLETIVQRHEALRTTFTIVDGQPVQIITPGGDRGLRLIDLRGLPEPERSIEAQRVAQEETRRPFDLTRGPMLRGTLVRLEDEKNHLLLVTHQIVCDGRSRQVLLNELASLYRAFSAGEPSPLAELPIQYVDFSRWQRQWLVGEALESQVAYWREKLGPAVSPLHLPTDGPRPASQASRAAVQVVALSDGLSRALRALSRDEGRTLFATLLAAFEALLHRDTGQDDILLFTSTPGRSRPELRGLIGLFANLVPLRASLSGNPSFRELLARIHEVLMEAYANQDVPFETLSEFLRPRQWVPHMPLVQVMVVFQNGPAPELELSGLKVMSLEVDHGTTKPDLTLALRDTSGRVTGWLRYNAELFDTTTIISMIERFEALLGAVVADPERRLLDLPVAMNRVKGRESEQWNEAPHVAPRDEVESRLVAICEDLFGLRPLGVRDDFFRLGAHSLLIVQLFARIERAFSRKLAPSILFRGATVEAIAEALRSNRAHDAPCESLRLLKQGGPGPALFLVHDGDGETLPYIHLVRRMPEDLTVYGIEPHGTERCPILHTRITDMAAHHVRQIRRIQPRGPYILGGLCAGGTIAFEMALQLEARGHCVGLVALLDAADPKVPRAVGRSRQRWARFLGAMRDVRGFLPVRVGRMVVVASRKLGNLAMYEMSTRARDLSNRMRFRLLRKVGDRGRPVPWYAGGLPVRSVFLLAVRDYEPVRILGAPVILRATDGEGGDEPFVRRYGDPLLGWGGRVKGDLELCDMPGGHSSMLQEPHVALVAKRLTAYMNRVLAPVEVRS